jgi:FkbM family methyltransferase
MIREILIHQGHKLKHYLYAQQPFTGRGKLLTLADKMIGSPKKQIILKTLHGFKICIDPVIDNGVEKSIFYTGTYEAGTLDIFSKILKPGDVFFDVGANIGLMTLFASKAVGVSGEVHSFEPEPDTFRILSKNIEINNAENIKLNNIALGSEQKEGLIYPNMEINRGASSIVKQDGSVGKKIRINTLDQYLKNVSPLNIKLIKIDIEGYELEMLKGAKHLLQTNNAPILCIEYSKHVEHVTDVGDIYDFITFINQYRIFKFVLWKEKVCQLTEVFSKEEMPLHDNVFCFLPHHLDKLQNTRVFSGLYSD